MGMGMLTCIGQDVNERLAQFIFFKPVVTFEARKYLYEACSAFRVFLRDGSAIE